MDNLRLLTIAVIGTCLIYLGLSLIETVIDYNLVNNIKTVILNTNNGGK